MSEHGGYSLTWSETHGDRLVRASRPNFVKTTRSFLFYIYLCTFSCPANCKSWNVCPSKTLTSLRIRAVWSESLIGALWVAKNSICLQSRNKTLIRLHGSADWFESSLYSHTNLYLMLNTGDLVKHFT